MRSVAISRGVADMACTSGCPTQDHESYASCLRSKTVKVAYCNSAGGWDATTQRTWDRELDAFESARAQGIQPAGTSMGAVREAVELSDVAGKAYDASTQTFK